MEEASDDFAMGFLDGVLSMLPEDALAEWGMHLYEEDLSSSLMVFKENYALELGS